MQIGCTKKLLEYLNIKSTQESADIAPFFSWSANLLTLNRRKTIVVMNDISRYGFVLYGITAKTLKSLDELMLDGVHSCLEEECIAPELIDRYMIDRGGITYGKTADRSTVARLNKLCERATYFTEDMTADTIGQQQLLGRINDDIFKIDGDYCKPGDLLCDSIAKFYSVENVRKCRAAVLDVTLKLDTPCSRRIVIPMNYTFDRLHRALQCLFNWQNYHLHEFILELYLDGRVKDSLVCELPEYEFDDETTRMDTAVRLSDVFPEQDEIIYHYDFGDDWYHSVKLVEITEDYDKKYPVCLNAEGAAPPEDVGGAGGYSELLRILSDKNDSEYNEMKTWADSMDYNPFDMERTNRRLRYSV